VRSATQPYLSNVRAIDAPSSWGYTPQHMTQAASQAAVFYRNLVRDRRVWTIFDDGGYPAPMTSSGRAMPFWSSKARAERAKIATHT
jgi:Protein of unknown function (DUF2750)